MPGDAVEVAPHLYKVIQDNDRVRILEVRARPGEKSEMHSHPSYVVIAITDCQLKFTLSDGRSMKVELEAGQARYSDALNHATEIAGNREAHVLLVELK